MTPFCWVMSCSLLLFSPNPLMTAYVEDGKVTCINNFPVKKSVKYPMILDPWADILQDAMDFQRRGSPSIDIKKTALTMLLRSVCKSEPQIFKKIGKHGFHLKCAKLRYAINSVLEKRLHLMYSDQTWYKDLREKPRTELGRFRCMYVDYDHWENIQIPIFGLTLIGHPDWYDGCHSHLVGEKGNEKQQKYYICNSDNCNSRDNFEKFCIKKMTASVEPTTAKPAAKFPLNHPFSPRTPTPLNDPHNSTHSTSYGTSKKSAIGSDTSTAETGISQDDVDRARLIAIPVAISIVGMVLIIAAFIICYTVIHRRTNGRYRLTSN